MVEQKKSNTSGLNAATRKLRAKTSSVNIAEMLSKYGVVSPEK